MSGHDDESTAAGRIVNRGKNDRMGDGPIAREKRRKFTPKRLCQRLDVVNIERRTLSKKMANRARRGFYGHQRAALSKPRRLKVKADKQSYQIGFQVRGSKRMCAECLGSRQQGPKKAHTLSLLERNLQWLPVNVISGHAQCFPESKSELGCKIIARGTQRRCVLVGEYNLQEAAKRVLVVGRTFDAP